MFESETFIQSSSLTLIFVTNPNQKILSCFYKKLSVDLHLFFGMDKKLEAFCVIIKQTKNSERTLQKEFDSRTSSVVLTSCRLCGIECPS